MKELLSNRRPEYVQKLIDAQYSRVASYPMKQGYRFLGDERTYSWSVVGTDTRELLKDNERSVLDVGAGAGKVVQSYVRRGYGNYGVAFTAHDYSNGQNPTVQPGDAHDLLDRLPDPDRKFDIVMSKWTLQHLADPIGCFEQMLNAAAEDGTVVTDMPMGRAALVAGCVNWLVEQEYFTVEGPNAADIQDEIYRALSPQENVHSPRVREVMLRRKADSDVPIRLPVSYASPLIGSTTAMYTLDDDA